MNKEILARLVVFFFFFLTVTYITKSLTVQQNWTGKHQMNHHPKGPNNKPGKIKNREGGQKRGPTTKSLTERHLRKSYFPPGTYDSLDGRTPACRVVLDKRNAKNLVQHSKYMTRLYLLGTHIFKIYTFRHCD